MLALSANQPFTIHYLLERKEDEMPKIEVNPHPQMIIVGLGYRGKNQAGEIPQLWEQLMTRSEEIKNRDDSIHAAYGISIMDSDYEATMVFDYVAGFPVEDDEAKLPEGLAQFTIPAGQYAVITCPNLNSIGSAYDAIYRWVEGSLEFEKDLSQGNFNFERYGEEFMPAEGSEKFFIYVPIKEK